MRITIRDIAKICGVSTGTVNRALHDKAGISAATKEKILGVIRELNFQPNYYARTLATGQTDTIGVVLPNVDNEFFAMICSAIEKQSWENDYLMNLALSNDRPERESEAIQSFIDRKVDGIIVFPVDRDPATIKKVLDKEINIVLLLNDLPMLDVSVVMVDDYNAIAEMVQHLITLGHRRIAYINGYQRYSDRYNNYITEERYRAYKDTLIRNHIMYQGSDYFEFDPRLYDVDDFTPLEKLLDRPDPPTAMVCFHDQIALWVIQGLERLGLKVPDDVSVTGFDNIREIRYIKPRLTTIEMPVDSIVTEALGLLKKKIEHKDPANQRIKLGAKIVNGESCRRI